MPLGLTEEHDALRETVRTFAGRRITPDVLRAAVDAERDELPPYFKELAAQGLLGLHLPEEHGGAGYGVLELAVVIEELGRATAPGPLLPTTLAAAVLARAGHERHLAELAGGTTLGAVGLGPGSLTATPTADGGVTLAGESDLVLGGHLAEVFVLATGEVTEPTWVVVPRSALDVTDLRGHDLTRRPSRVRAADVTVPAGDVLALDARLPFDLAATLFAAESSGIAAWATETAAEYARVREQFGRPIGQFQGVKHRCARMLARAEQASASAWDAARAWDASGRADPGEADEGEQAAEERAFAAAVAGAEAVAAAFENAKDCIQVLGGIGFTWEHDAHLYLRRAQTLRAALGRTAHWRRRVAELALAGVRRGLSVELPPHAETVRDEVREELRAAAALDGAEQRTYLADHGYTAPHLPSPWGKDADAVAQLVIDEELRAADLTPVDMVIGGWVVPTLVAHGDSAQQERFLQPTLRGELTWCQLFSEPGAGSDLAGLSTRAERVEGGWRVTGQKVWTSMAKDAQWGILLARTDPEAPKHRGISYFLLDMASPGIDIRPLRQLTGEAEFNEVFLDEVFIPDELLVSEPGNGWKLARTTLANERVALSRGSSLGDGGELLLQLAVESEAAGELDDERRTVLGGLLSDAHAGGLLSLRGTLRSLAGGQPGAEASIAKLLGVEQQQRVWETAVEWTGLSALTGEGKRHDPTWWFLSSRNLSIAGGTTEVQLNIIGERLLRLPRDPEPAARRA